MAVQQEIKSQLAKLLATEDIVVEHKHVETAQFNTDTRVLILPIWEKASNYVYDMLVGHEVGHALFTPNEDPPKDIPHSFLNVCEDARIEKLMKRKYLGIAKSFYRGYSEMYDDDFFELDGEDIDNFNLADRANLHFKIGSFLPISFSDPEKEIITLIQNAETFTDTITAAEALYNFCKQEQEKQKQDIEVGQQSSLSPVDSSSDIAGDNTSPIPDSPGSDAVEDRSDSDFVPPIDDDPVVDTADTLQSKLEELVDDNGVENEYIEIPKVDLEKIIVSNSEVHQEIDESWNEQQKTIPTMSLFTETDEQYDKFKSDAKKEVSYLVKEFECRKSASAYARSATSRTGVLDTEKLSSYRFSEDLFKRVTILPDGKNHGLVFILDWSGSMQYVMKDTLKQLYNLMWFCKKVQIPFEVYAFSNEWREETELPYEVKEGVFVIDDKFNLLNLFTSKVNAKTLDHQMLNIWRIAHSFAYSSYFAYPQRLVLSGTPLNESLVSLHQIIPQFKKESGAEKVHCIVLTDGEGNYLPYHKYVKRYWEEEPYLGTRNINPKKCFLRDRKLGKTYRFKWNWYEFTDLMLENLKDNFPTVNFIGIRVLGPRDARSFMKLYGEDEKVQRDWRKNKSFTIKNSGYDAYFAMSSAVLSEDAEFEVDEDATKAQIKRAFVKSLKTKKLNKKVLGEFVELVA